MILTYKFIYEVNKFFYIYIVQNFFKYKHICTIKVFKIKGFGSSRDNIE